jgi:hypothetical protein
MNNKRISLIHISWNLSADSAVLTHTTQPSTAPSDLALETELLKNVCIYVCEFHHFICFYLQILVERAILQVNIGYYSMQSASRDENKRNSCGLWLGAPVNE